ALEDADRATALPGVGEALAQRRQLRDAADQRRFRLGEARRGLIPGHRRAPRRCLQQLAVQPARVRVGLDAQLALESRDADLVLAQSSSEATLLGIEAHERSVRRLLRRIERE